MPIKIVADGAVQASLGRVFGRKEIAADVAVVQLETTDASAGLRSLFGGLTSAVEMARQNVPVLALSFTNQRILADDMRWHALMGHTHVLSCRLPAGLMEALNEALALPIGVRDPLALRLLDTGLVDDVFRSLQHDLPHAENKGEEALVIWEARAKQFLGEMSRTELMALVKRGQPQLMKSGPYVGESFPDVCVDVEGTIFDSHGAVRQDVIEQVKAEAADRPVTIWTGGNVKLLAKRVRAAGLTWKMVSKYQMRGATVAVAYDDMSQADFARRYGVNVLDYRHV